MSIIAATDMQALHKVFKLLFDIRVKQVQSIGGGSINPTYRAELADNRLFFIKGNKKNFADNFLQEKFNLEYLKSKSSLRIPSVIHFHQDENNCYLVLEYLEKSFEDSAFEFSLGKGLAELHKNTEKFFGWYQDNYIGSLKQSNTQCSEWNEFFVTQRLEPLMKMCYDKQMLSSKDIRAFENLFYEIKNIFPDELPALLHGDLWTGNRMNTNKGVAVFDPACYFGHREMDIAMLNLFGNVSSAFYDGYNSIYVLEKTFKERIDICNLYPLLVHAVLFGNSYIYNIKSIIKKFQ